MFFVFVTSGWQITSGCSSPMIAQNTKAPEIPPWAVEKESTMSRQGLGVSEKSLTAQWSVWMLAQETWNPNWSSAFGVFLGSQSDMIRAPPSSSLTGSALLPLPLKMRKLC